LPQIGDLVERYLGPIDSPTGAGDLCKQRSEREFSTMNPSGIFEAWRSADQSARIAERTMFDEAMRALEGMCNFPSSTRREQTVGLRAQADELFKRAMARMVERR
jgi:hypothetical protein